MKQNEIVWKPQPTKKSKEVEEVIEDLTGFVRKEAITRKQCVFCQTPVELDSFNNDLRLKEFHISGICQTCQDKVFG